jgi:hypothetical protein
VSSDEASLFVVSFLLGSSGFNELSGSLFSSVFDCSSDLFIDFVFYKIIATLLIKETSQRQQAKEVRQLTKNHYKLGSDSNASINDFNNFGRVYEEVLLVGYVPETHVQLMNEFTLPLLLPVVT